MTMKEMWIIITMLAFALIVIVALPKSDSLSFDEECQKAYGKEYRYVYGDRSPDLCATKDGKVKYYDLIK